MRVRYGFRRIHVPLRREAAGIQARQIRAMDFMSNDLLKGSASVV